MWSLVYLFMRTLVALIIGTGKRGRDEHAKDLEILVLRHQLRVLQRTAGRPQLRTVDRVLLAAASRALPRDRWVAFLVTPATLLRWHDELVKRRWTYRRTGRPGRPPIEPAVRTLILRLARENPRFRLRADRGRAPQARHLGQRDDGPHPAPGRPARSRPAARRARPGPSSCGRQPAVASPATAAPSRPPGSALCTSSCSSSWAAGGST